jgi:hypothetical protein
MQKKDLSRRPSGKRREDAAPSGKPAPAQPQAAREVTEQELEQVQGGRAPVRVVKIDSTDE